MKKISILLGLVFLLTMASIYIPGDSWSEEIPDSSSIELISPPDEQALNPATVFKWTPSKNPDVGKYRLEISEDESFGDGSDSTKIVTDYTNVAVVFEDFNLNEGFTQFWRVIGLDQNEVPVEKSKGVPFEFTFFTDLRGFTLMGGLVRSNRNLAALAGARVAVSSQRHRLDNFSSEIDTGDDGHYSLVAVNGGDEITIEPPIKVTFTKKGFLPQEITVDDYADIELDTVVLESTAGANSVFPSILPLLTED